MTAPAASLLDTDTGVACVVTHVTVVAEVTALDASIRLTQGFTNPLDRPIEAVYVFPLPPLAAVTAMTATLGARTVVATLAERGKARAEYARAVAGGQRAALAEEERPSTFTMSVGNLGAGEQAEVVLELVG
ncbi:MAG TPA: VIT domain-containing protein, partial [Acidimicrobiales bacterium]